MTQTSRPWTGTTTGDAGAYSDSQWRDSWAAAYHAWAHGTGYGNRGPIIDSGDAPNTGLQVQATSPASASVEVLPGAALVEGGLYLNDATETLSIAANSSGNPRIDTIVLRKDDIAQMIRLTVKQGTPAATPVPPALTQTAGTMWEIPLRDIAVANGFTSIADTDITPREEWANAADGVYIKDVLNDSGGTLETGDVVVWTDANDRAVTTTTQENHPFPAGVWVGRTQNGDYGRVLTLGIGWVRVSAAFNDGTGIYTATTAKQARANGATTRQTGNLGFLMGDSTGAGQLVLAFIDARRNLVEYARYTYTVAQNTAGETYASGADRTVPLNTEVADPGNIGSLSSNAITLQPGRYFVNGTVGMRGNNSSGTDARVFLYDTTNSAELLTGPNNRQGANAHADVWTFGYIEVPAQIVVELRTRVSATTQAAQPLNVAGVTETYSILTFERPN